MNRAVDEPLLARARDAMDRQAWGEAYGMLSEAARGLDVEGLEVLAEAAYLAGFPEVAVTTWERLYALKRKAGDPEGAAAAAAQVAILMLDAGHYTLSAGWSRKAEELLSAGTQSAVHGMLAVVVAWPAILAGDFDRGMAAARRAVEIGTAVGDAAIRAMGRNAEARILIFRGHLDEGLAILDEAAVSIVSGELEPLATSLLYCSTVCAYQGLAEYDRAEEWTGEMEHWTAHNPSGSFHGFCRVHRAEILKLRGEWQAAETEAEEASAEVRKYAKGELGWPVAELGQVRLRMGNLAGAEEAFLEAYELGWDPNPGLALLRLAQGDAEEAAAIIQDSLDTAPDVASWEAPPNTALRRAPRLAAQVEIALARDDVDTARTAVEELDDIAVAYRSKALKASAAVAEGWLRLAEGDAARAQRRFQDGMHLWTQVGAPYETARARMGLGLGLRASGNEHRALLELRTARTTFERLGAELDVRRAADAAGDREVKPGPRLDRVFMFTDIVQSTNLVELIGDEAWGHLVRWHNDTLAALVRAHQGEVVRTTGDGFFVTFEATESAIECAIAIQRALDDHRHQHGFAPKVRIGLHRAEATREGTDWSGKGVHAAARIGALAEGEEILASLDTARAGGTVTVSDPRTVSLKGIFEPVEVVAVAWR